MLVETGSRRKASAVLFHSQALTLLLLAGVEVIWLRWHARRVRDSFVADRDALRLAVPLSSVELGVVFSAFWGLPGVIAFLLVAMAVSGVGVVVMFVRGA